MRIGNIEIEKPLLLAPMEDVTDLPFRLICKKLGADIMYTEFVNAEGLSRKSNKTYQKMIFLEQERPFGIQIYGGNECSMENAAQMAEELHPDIIDINCGCWVKNVANRGAGAGLLRDLPKMREIISATVNAVQTPVTVKTRLGWDEKSIQIVDVAKMVEDCGAQALTIHCRTRAQGHSGAAEYKWIPEVKNAVQIPIIVNGDITTPQIAKQVFEETGCDGVMIGRGAINNPWIFYEIKHYFRTGELLPPVTIFERIETMKEHLQLAIEHKGERRGVMEFRKYYSGYLRSAHSVAALRTELMKYVSVEEVVQTIDWYARKIEENNEAPFAVSG